MKFLPVTSNVSTLVRILKPLVLQTSKDRHTLVHYASCVDFSNGSQLSFCMHFYTIWKFWYFCTFSLIFSEKMAVYLHMYYFKSMLYLNFWFSACFCQHGPTRLILDTVSYATATSCGNLITVPCQKPFLKSENNFDFWLQSGLPLLDFRQHFPR